jgi:uncharacterized coiled-coil protein SlyX
VIHHKNKKIRNSVNTDLHNFIYTTFPNGYYLGDGKSVLDPNKDKALEALDFVISVLREHEKDLDKLVCQLDNITERFGENNDLSIKFERLEKSLQSLQDNLTNLTNCLSNSQNAPVNSLRPSSIKVNCLEWRDFRALATNAETVSVIMGDSKKSFQVCALKNSKILSYKGEIPENTLLLKLWLSNELSVSEQDVIEGTFDRF